MKGLTVVVTGGTGFIGSNLVRRIIAEGAIVHLFSRKTSDFIRIEDVRHLLTIHEVDLTESDTVRRTLELIKPDGVFHLAALNSRYGMVPTSEDLLRENTMATINLMDAVDQFEYKFFVNTGTAVEVGPKGAAVREDDLCEPTEMYSISKLATTLYAQALGKRNQKPIVTLRVFTPYGPFMQKGKIVTQLIEGALAQKEIKLSHQKVNRDFIYIDDLVELYVRLADNAAQHPGGIFNGGSGIATELGSLVEIVEKCANMHIPAIWSGQAATYDHSVWQADLTKVNKEIGWSPKISLEEGIQRSVAWFLEHQNYWKD